jgi:hypothetical protein
MLMNVIIFGNIDQFRKFDKEVLGAVELQFLGSHVMYLQD